MQNSEYLIVHKKILPEYFSQVIQARSLLENHEVETVTEAVKKVGISRNTYYRYKDYLFEISDNATSRTMTISLILKDESGALTAVLQTLSEAQASVLTISQAIPVDGYATVLISLDISKMENTPDNLLKQLLRHSCVRKVQLDAIA